MPAEEEEKKSLRHIVNSEIGETRDNYERVSEETKHHFDIYADIELDAGVPMFGLFNPFESLTVFRCCAPCIVVHRFSECKRDDEGEKRQRDKPRQNTIWSIDQVFA